MATLILSAFFMPILFAWVTHGASVKDPGEKTAKMRRAVRAPPLDALWPTSTYFCGPNARRLRASHATFNKPVWIDSQEEKGLEWSGEKLTQCLTCSGSRAPAAQRLLAQVRSCPMFRSLRERAGVDSARAGWHPGLRGSVIREPEPCAEERWSPGVRTVSLRSA